MKHPLTKKKNHVKKIQKGSIGNKFIYIMLGITLVGGYVFVGGLPNEAPTTGTPVKIVAPTPETAKKSLQLETFGFIPIKPTVPLTQESCPRGKEKPDDNGVPQPLNCKCDAFDDTIAINCKGGLPFDDAGNSLLGTGKPICDARTLPLCAKPEKICGSEIAPTDGRFCIAKPVIYLYPEVPTEIDVKVKTAGKIVISDPLYPAGGWQNVLAYPSGDLYYQNKHYIELFYESEVTDFKKPEKGILIPSKHLQEQLGRIIDQLGLIKKEKEEFMNFWVPRLQNLNSPYIFFSVLDKTEKERLDKVYINPQPDTMIEFIAYFKPITNPASAENSLKLPEKPQRKGFTSVEWGGVIDTNK